MKTRTKKPTAAAPPHATHHTTADVASTNLRSIFAADLRIENARIAKTQQHTLFNNASVNHADAVKARDSLITGLRESYEQKNLFTQDESPHDAGT